MVDEDGSGSLDFEEFVQLLLIYRPPVKICREQFGILRSPKSQCHVFCIEEKRKDSQSRRLGLLNVSSRSQFFCKRGVEAASHFHSVCRDQVA